MSDMVFCYPNSDVLKNKIGIRNKEQFERLEKRLTMLRILELVDKPIQGKFDLGHLQSIHKYIFQDVYDWAGKIRKVDIAKGNMPCTPSAKATDAASASLSEPWHFTPAM